MSVSEPIDDEVNAGAGEPEEKLSVGRTIARSLSLRFVLSQADGYPVVIKQFLQFCLLLIYPAWAFAVLAGAVCFYPLYGLLWLLFWPVRAWMKKNRPDDYAASQLK
jgi:YggT family protein